MTENSTRNSQQNVSQRSGKKMSESTKVRSLDSCLKIIRINKLYES